MLPGVVRPASWADRRESELMAAQLYLGPSSYITGSTAARMQGLRAMPARPLRYACRERCRAALPGWLHAVWTPWASRQDVVELPNGLRRARAHPMLLALAVELDDRTFGRAAEDAWHEGLITPESAARFLQQWRRSGLRGVGRYARWLDAVAGRDRPAQSGFELDVIEALLAAGLPEPARQHPLLLADGATVHLDVAWPDVRLAVEPGHSWWHGGDERMHADQARDRRCSNVGWQVMRYGEVARADLAAAACEVRATYDVRRAQLLGHEPVRSDGAAAKKLPARRNGPVGRA